MVDLSKSQDNETGDGTTGVVVLAGCLLQQAEMLIDKGLNPHQIIEGYDKAVEKSVKHLEFIQTKIDPTENNNEHLIKAAITALGSKIVSKCQRKLAEIAVQAIMSVFDNDRKDVNFELIKVLNAIKEGRFDKEITKLREADSEEEKGREKKR